MLIYSPIFGKTAVQNAFTIGYWILGVAAGALIANTLFPEAQPLVYEAAGLGLGVPISLMAGYDKNLHYQVDPIEIRARRYEQRANQVEFKNLVETVVNPQVDLDYIHNICRNEGTDLAISNREILDLRFGG